MRSLRIGLACAYLLASVLEAMANAGTITVLDSTGTTKTFDVITDGSGNFVSKQGICDQSAAANCAGVDAGHSLQIAGEGTAGSAAGGVVSIQGVASGTNVPVVLNAETTKVIGEVNQGTSPWIVAGGGTAGSAASGVATIQGIASMTPVQVSQATAANLNATVVGTGTFAVQATLQASATTAIGKVDPNTAAMWGLAAVTQNVAAPTNGLLGLCQFTTSPAIISTTNVSPLQCNNSNSLLVNVTNTNTNGQATAANSSPVVEPVLTNGGAAVVKGGVAVVNGGSFYEAIAASQTATVLQSSTGAAGDYLSHCVIYPASTSPGVVTVFDNTNTAANSAILFAGGSSSVSNLAPIPVPVGANSVNGAWKVTTGVNVSVACFGKFSQLLNSLLDFMVG